MLRISKEERNVLYVLLRMNMKRSDYKSFLGVFWSFLGPAITFAITYLIFEERFGKSINHFPLRLLIGIITLGFFATCVTHTLRFLHSNKDNLLNATVPSRVYLITSLYVPAVKLCTELTLCLCISLALGILHWQYLPAVLLILPFYFLLAAGFGLILCVANCFAGDIGEIWNVLSRMLIFITPTFYTLNMLSPWAGKIITYLNPITSFIITFQYVFTGEPIPGFHGVFTIFHAVIYSSAVFIIGYRLLKKFEKQLIERI